MINLNKTWIDIQCPQCSYIDEVQLIDVKTEKTVFCHNCKIMIKLIDGNASVHVAIENINSQLKKLEKALKNIGK